MTIVPAASLVWKATCSRKLGPIAGSFGRDLAATRTGCNSTVRTGGALTENAASAAKAETACALGSIYAFLEDLLEVAVEPSAPVDLSRQHCPVQGVRHQIGIEGRSLDVLSLEDLLEFTPGEVVSEQ